MGARLGTGVEHGRIAGARRRAAPWRLLVAIAPGAVGERRDVGPAVHGPRGPGPRRGLAYGRASRAGAPPRGRHPAADDREGSGSGGRAVTAARLLPHRSVAELARRGAGLDAKTLAAAARI